MPSKKSENEDEKGLKNLTLRLPDDYHRQLATQSGRKGLTLNAHLLSIVERHLLETGYFPEVIKSLSGRLFEIEVEPIVDRYSGFLCSRFDVYENHPLYRKRRAHYIFGVSSQLFTSNEPHGEIKDLGLALLNFYNRRALEIDQLAWQTTDQIPANPSSKMTDNWRFIGSSTTKNLTEFMLALARNHWKDDLLVVTGQSQDIRCGLRSEEDLFR